MSDQAGRTTIEREEMMTPMLSACPSFTPKWMEFLEEWVGNPVLFEEDGDGSLPIYLALSDLADHLVQKLERGGTEEFPRIFAVVERWICEGSDYVGEAAVVGLLEDLQNTHRYKTAVPEDWLPWLGPEALKWWVEVSDFWDRLEAGKFRPLSID